MGIEHHKKVKLLILKIKPTVLFVGFILRNICLNYQKNERNKNNHAKIEPI